MEVLRINILVGYLEFSGAVVTKMGRDGPNEIITVLEEFCTKSKVTKVSSP